MGDDLLRAVLHPFLKCSPWIISFARNIALWYFISVCRYLTRKGKIPRSLSNETWRMGAVSVKVIDRALFIH